MWEQIWTDHTRLQKSTIRIYIFPVYYVVDEAKTSRGFQTLALHGEYSTHAVKEIEFQKTTDFPGGVKILVSLL